MEEHWTEKRNGSGSLGQKDTLMTLEGYLKQLIDRIPRTNSQKQGQYPTSGT